MKILPCHAMRSAEQELFDTGRMSSEELMDSAIDSALGVLQRDAEFAHAAERFPQAIVYAGKGKNAGDAIGLALGMGFSRIILRCAAAPEHMAPETRRFLAEPGGTRLAPVETCPHVTPAGALLIDGLLGSGACGTLRPEYAALVEEMNTLRAGNRRCTTLAVDIPTGLHADEGALSHPIVQADATLAIGCVKPGMVADGAEDYVGRLLCVPLPEVNLPPAAAYALAEDTLDLLPRRAYSCYKNRAGRVRIIAGSPGYTGAAEMCTRAALAAGAGLVELYCLPEVYPILASRIAPEAMVHPVASYDEVPAEGAEALLIGPGIGRPDASNTRALQKLAENPPCPLVLDADGLTLAAAGAWLLSPRCILTPHPGEMRRLYPAAAELTRAECAVSYVQAHPCTLLLKGARSIITDGHTMLYNTTGGPYMANGGQGDVLAGVIAAYAAQGVAPLQAATLGAYTCGRAAGLARAAQGFPHAVGATQLLPWLTAAYH